MYSEKIKKFSKMFHNCDAILIGAGSGLSAAAGLCYGGQRFTRNFREFIEKYGKENMPDMYTAGFYPFESQEAKWGYWSKHALFNRFFPDALELYIKLYELVKDKDYFVITTNVDHQFYKAGFEENRIFATQGDYGEIQCEYGCHDKVYDAEKIFYEMDSRRQDCLIPSALVPKCPVCGRNMAMHLRCDKYFVEDEKWHNAASRYNDFINKHHDKKVLLLELGVGYNTPGIIRYPFDYLVKNYSSFSLVRLNRDYARVPLNERAIGIEENIDKVISDLMELL